MGWEIGTYLKSLFSAPLFTYFSSVDADFFLFSFKVLIILETADFSFWMIEARRSFPIWTDSFDNCSKTYEVWFEDLLHSVPLHTFAFLLSTFKPLMLWVESGWGLSNPGSGSTSLIWWALSSLSSTGVVSVPKALMKGPMSKILP